MSGFKKESVTDEGERKTDYRPVPRAVARAALKSGDKTRKGRKARAKLRRIYAAYFGEAGNG